MKKPILLLVIFAAGLLFAAETLAGGAEEFIDRIDKVYSNLGDITFKFTQKSYLNDFDKTETYEGQLLMKPPSDVLWSYSGEKAQSVLISGDDIQFYQHAKKQLIKRKFSSGYYGQLPLMFLTGRGDIRKDFEYEWREGVLDLVPKKPMGRVKRMELRPSDSGFPIKSLFVVDELDNTIEIIIREPEINSGLKDEDFRIDLEPGSR